MPVPLTEVSQAKLKNRSARWRTGEAGKSARTVDGRLIAELRIEMENGERNAAI